MKVIAKPSAPSIVGWLDEGECVTVLALSVTPHEGVKFLIWSNKQEAVALFSAGEFDVVDGRLSRRWVFNLNSQGFAYLAPDKWQVDGFWEKYHDGDFVSEQTFEQERTLIFAE